LFSSYSIGTGLDLFNFLPGSLFLKKNMTIADLSALTTLPIPHLSSVKPKTTSMKCFKKDSVLSKPNGHLLKAVHPLFTGTKTKNGSDLICFDALDRNTNHVKEQSPADLVLYSSAIDKPMQLRLGKEIIFPIWDKIIDIASEVFSPVKQTNSKMLDAFHTQKGYNYLLSLHAIHLMISRIRKSLHSYDDSRSDLASRCDILLASWNNLVDIVDTEEFKLQLPDELERTDHVCNLCGANTNVDNTHFDKGTELSYHISCVNFWVNLVEAVLPIPS